MLFLILILGNINHRPEPITTFWNAFLNVIKKKCYCEPIQEYLESLRQQ